MTEHTFVAIVGGGLTGLALANQLRANDVPHVVLEADDRVGGVIRSGYVEDSLLEWGPQRSRLTASFKGLAQSLGISDRLITAPAGLPLHVWSRGKLRRVPFSVVDFFRSDIVPPASRLRVLGEPFTAGALPNESVAQYFTRKLGRRVYENIAGPLYGGLYASDPADMVVCLSLDHVLKEMGVGRSLALAFLRRGGRVEPPPACSFQDGMETLALALHAANSRNVRVEAPVRVLHRHPDGWLLDGDAGRVIAEQVVLTGPAPATAAILGGEFGAVPDAIRSLTYNPLVIVHLHADESVEGLGLQVGLGERLVTRGVTFNDSLFGRRGVYTAYLGGARAPEVLGWGADAITATALREFRLMTGIHARVLSIRAARMPAWDKSWSAIERLELPPGIHLAANWESRPGIPGRLAQAKRLADSLTLAYGAHPRSAAG
jgi:oxygen-dependent protoporphyrinogen oxidase